jgi:hypothetical protein
VQDGIEQEVKDAEAGLRWAPKRIPSVTVGHHIDEFAAVVHHTLVVDEQWGPATYKGAERNFRSEAALGRGEDSAASWIAQVFEDSLETRRSDQLDPCAYVCTADKFSGDKKALPLTSWWDVQSLAGVVGLVIAVLVHNVSQHWEERHKLVQ